MMIKTKKKYTMVYKNIIIKNIISYILISKANTVYLKNVPDIPSFYSLIILL